MDQPSAEWIVSALFCIFELCCLVINLVCNEFYDEIETYFNFEDDTNFQFPYKYFWIASFVRFVHIHEETDRFLVIYCKKSLFSIKIVRTKLKTQWDNGYPSEMSDDKDVALTSFMHLLLCACHKSVLMIRPNRSPCIISLCMCAHETGNSYVHRTQLSINWKAMSSAFSE